MLTTFCKAPYQASTRFVGDVAAVGHLHIAMAAAVAGIALSVGVLYLACAGDANRSSVGTWSLSDEKATAPYSLLCNQYLQAGRNSYPLPVNFANAARHPNRGGMVPTSTSMGKGPEKERSC